MFHHSLWIGCVLNPGLRLDWHGRPRVGGRFLRGVSRQRRTGCVGWCWMIILVAGENDVSYGKFLYCHSHTGASFTSVDLYWLYMWYCHFFTSFYLWIQIQSTESRFLRSISGPRDDSEVGTLGCQERQGAAGTEGVFPRASRGSVEWLCGNYIRTWWFIQCVCFLFKWLQMVHLHIQLCVYIYNYVYIYILIIHIHTCMHACIHMLYTYTT